tara:strand:+ start:572 stop:700 length:129 start_codon:yes stop_codon:yes gene_type:complete
MAIVHEKTPFLGVSRRFFKCLRLSLADRNACGFSFLLASFLE